MQVMQIKQQDVKKYPIRVLPTKDQLIKQHQEKLARNGQLKLLNPMIGRNLVTTTTVETLMANLVYGATLQTRQKDGSCVMFYGVDPRNPLDARKNPIRVLPTKERGIRQYPEKSARNGHVTLLTPIVRWNVVTTTTAETLEITSLVYGATLQIRRKDGSCVMFHGVDPMKP